MKSILSINDFLTVKLWLLVAAFGCVLEQGHAGVEISELMAKNDSGLMTSAGEYEDWVEIHNDSGASVDLAGWYLTDDPSDLRKWQFPSTATTSSLAVGGYLVVFADDSPTSVIGSEVHANFKLASGGEFLALIEPDGETVAYQYSPTYPAQSSDVSYGIDSGTGSPAYFSSPTPGLANGAAIAEPIQFSDSSKTFTTNFDLTLSTNSVSATIRYTTDGSIPTGSSSLYGTPISINGTVQIRARAFESGLVDGPVVSASFFKLQSGPAAFTSNLPVVVIDNFNGGDIPHPDSSSRQACEVMIFEPVNGTTQLSAIPTITSRAGIRRRGESTLRNTNSKPNISLETWGEVDEDSRSIEPFGMPAESDWVLYAPWDIDTAMIRNSFMYEVSNEAGRYAVRTRFVEVYLNHQGGNISDSDYYGVYVFMEKIKQGPNRVDVADLPAGVTTEPDLTGGYIWKKDKDDPNDQNFNAAGKTLTSVYPKTMPTAQLNWLTGELNAVDSAIPNGNYESLIDVASFADHHILNVFANNADGLNFSTFYHKDRNGLINMGPIWDFDRSMSCDNDARASDPEVWSLATDQLFFFHSSGPMWFRDLALNDPDFWMVWVDRWQAMRNGPLSDAAMDARIEGYRTELSSAALRNCTRWGVISPGAWTGKVDVMKTHALTRGQWIDDQLIDPPVFSHAGGAVSSGYQLIMTGPNSKYFTTDGSDPRASGGSAAGAAYSSSISITQNTVVKARAGNGANFINAPSTWPWSPLTEAVFVVDVAPLAITELMYHPRPPSGAAEMGFGSSDFEYVEVQNTSASTCDLLGVQLLDGVLFDFTHGNSTTLAAGAYGVVVGNLDAFKARYTNWSSLNILGTFEGSLSNGPERVELGYSLSGLGALAEFTYEDDWYPSTDGEGFSLVLNDAQSAPGTWGQKEAWRHSSGVDGSPGVADPALAYPQGSLVINEVLTHQDVSNPGDWIEICNTTGSDINIGGWLLSDSRGDLEKYVIPGGTMVPANGYLVLTEFTHFGSAFALNEHGDSVYLSAGSGGSLSEPAYRVNEGFGAQDPDVTFGRHVRSDGMVDFPAQASATMGTANSAPLVGSIVIDELMYHPPSGSHEYVVLRNNSAVPVDLFDPANPSNVWKASGIDFEFPIGTQLGAFESLVLVRDTITPALFRSTNSVPVSIDIFSFTGALDNDKDTLVLRRPGPPEAGTGFVPYIEVERVSYTDDFPWPTTADGLGKSLGRIIASSYANDPANWQAINGAYVPPTFSLIVLSGSGDGGYANGAVVALQADAPAPNQTFVGWIGNVAGIANVGAASTTMTMSAQDLTVTALYSTETTFIAENATWSYHDQGVNLGTAWRVLDQPELTPGSGWSSGPALLGYESGEATTVSYGGDLNNKHITTYFLNTFVVPDASEVETLSLELLRDDGAVIHLHGDEVKRDNMPLGAVTYSTLAMDTVSDGDEITYFPHTLDPVDLVDGDNIMAVEIHQKAVDSSDLSFALRLKGILKTDVDLQDGDADGMGDAFEVLHFGSTEAGLPGNDTDGDGVLDGDEYLAGTLPGDPTSFFRIEQIDGSEITWIAVSGRKYTVYWSPDLQTPFVSIATDLSGGSYNDTAHAGDPRGFYRIEVELE